MASRPNVVVFLTDQQRADTTGLGGNPMGLTPCLDEFGHRGTHFSNAVTPQPVCAPARSVLQTGLYATETTVFRNGCVLPPELPTVAAGFRAAGFDTGYIGKWHLAGEHPVTVEHRAGYEHWLAANAVEHVSDAYDTWLWDADNQPVRLPGYRVDATVDAAIRFIATPRDRPFFLFLSLLEPHHQNRRDDYAAPEGVPINLAGQWTPPDLAALGGSSAWQLPSYYAIVRRIDQAFGRLLDALRSVGQLDSTVVMFLSDHGCHFKTRNSEYKRSCHESSIRIPAVAGGPGFDGGGRVEEIVSLVDVVPTLLDAADVPVPAGVRGRSMSQLVGRGSREWTDQAFVQISESEVGRAIRTRRWKYHVEAPQADVSSDLGSDRYEEAELYDLRADPYELVNLIGQEAYDPVIAVMRERLRRGFETAGETPATIVPAARRPQMSQRQLRSGEERE